MAALPARALQYWDDRDPCHHRLRQACKNLVDRGIRPGCTIGGPPELCNMRLMHTISYTPLRLLNRHRAVDFAWFFMSKGLYRILNNNGSTQLAQLLDGSTCRPSITESSCNSLAAHDSCARWTTRSFCSGELHKNPPAQVHSTAWGSRGTCSQRKDRGPSVPACTLKSWSRDSSHWLARVEKNGKCH